jgi:hypothetical protein
MNLSPACSSSDISVGVERAACGKAGECDEGLECWSERCVRPEGADCRAVGERIASSRLGNYATREEREPEVGTWQKACEAARLTKKEGRCIVEAAGEEEMAACERPLVPELVGDPKGCERVGDKAAELLAEAGGRLSPIRNVIDEVPAVVTGMCVDGRWKREAKECLMAAGTYGEAEKCVAMLDLGDRKAVERRLTQLVKKGGLVRTPPVDPGDETPSACKKMQRTMRAYESCPQMPADGRKAMEEAMKQMETAWRDAKGEARKAMNDACVQAEAAMAAAIEQLGCKPAPGDPWE